MDHKQILFLHLPLVDGQLESADTIENIVIGVYIPNGVMHEQIEEYGLSYCTDSLIYTSLEEADIFDHGANIHGATYYGYSEFLITAPPALWSEALRCLFAGIFGSNFNADQWKKVREETIIHIQKHKPNLWQRFWTAKDPSNRYASPISGSKETIIKIPIRKVSEWMRQYYELNQMFLCITGHWYVSMKEEIFDLLQPYKDILPKTEKILTHREIKKSEKDMVLPGREKAVELLLAFSCSISPEEVLSGEALCRRLEDILAKGPCKKIACRVELTIATEIILQIQCRVSKRLTFCVLCEIAKTIGNWGKEIDAPDFENLKNELWETYQALMNKPLEYNQFVGWNAIVGPWYNIDTLQSKELFFQAIKLEKMRSISARFFHVENLSIYLKGMKNEEAGIRLCEQFREMLTHI